MRYNITGKVSVTIDAPATRVWEALTTPDLIKRYFFGTTAISDWQVGNPIIFKGEYKGKSYEDKGTILRSEPYTILSYKYLSSMSGMDDEPENYVTVTYRLSERNDTTEITVTQDNIRDQKMKEHSEQNWEKVLLGLKDMLEKEELHLL